MHLLGQLASSGPTQHLARSQHAADVGRQLLGQAAAVDTRIARLRDGWLETKHEQDQAVAEHAKQLRAEFEMVRLEL